MTDVNHVRMMGRGATSLLATFGGKPGEVEFIESISGSGGEVVGAPMFNGMLLAGIAPPYQGDLTVTSGVFYVNILDEATNLGLNYDDVTRVNVHISGGWGARGLNVVPLSYGSLPKYDWNFYGYGSLPYHNGGSGTTFDIDILLPP